MGSQFFALPLSSGESFLLRTPDAAGRERVILVDAGKKYGKKSRELAKVLSKISPRIDHIDFAICTHSDADHSQGFWHFADDWYGLNRSIGEFWLPGRWANSMPTILVDPVGFASKLIEGAMQAGRLVQSKDVDTVGVAREERFREIALKDIKEMSPASLRATNTNKSETFASELGLTEDELTRIISEQEEVDDSIDPFDAALITLQRRYNVHLGLYYQLYLGAETRDELAMTLEGSVAFQEVAETAKAIRKIALSAIAHGIRVRWFDFGEYSKSNKPSGGEPGLLEPLCAVEVIPNPSGTINLSALMLFHSLKLSRQNVESLVFYRPEGDEPGALFLGDSRLAHGISKPGRSFPVPFNKPNSNIIVTAPHHGSRNNDHAYTVVKKWTESKGQYYVRNGGQSGQKLGVYSAQKYKRCAQCVQCRGKTWRQWVQIDSNGGKWNWPPNSIKCNRRFGDV